MRNNKSNLIIWVILLLLTISFVIAQGEDDSAKDEAVDYENFLKEPTPEGFRNLPQADQSKYLSTNYDVNYASIFFEKKENVGVNSEVDFQYFGDVNNVGKNKKSDDAFFSGSYSDDPSAHKKKLREFIIGHSSSAKKYFSDKFDAPYEFSKISDDFEYDANKKKMFVNGKTILLPQYKNDKTIKNILVLEDGFRIIREVDGESREIEIKGDGESNIDYKEGEFSFKVNGKKQKFDLTGSEKVTFTFNEDGSYHFNGPVSGKVLVGEGKKLIEFNNHYGVLKFTPTSDGNVKIEADNAEVITSQFYADGHFVKVGNKVTAWDHGDTNRGNLRQGSTVIIHRESGVGAISQGQNEVDGTKLVVNLDQISPTSSFQEPKRDDEGKVIKPEEKPKPSVEDARKAARELQPASKDIGGNAEVWIKSDRHGGGVTVTAKGRVEVGFWKPPLVLSQINRPVEYNLRPNFVGKNGISELDMKVRTPGEDVVLVRGAAKYKDRFYSNMETSENGASFKIKRSNPVAGVDAGEDILLVDCFGCQEGSTALDLKKRVLVVSDLGGGFYSEQNAKLALKEAQELPDSNPNKKLLIELANERLKFEQEGKGVSPLDMGMLFKVSGKDAQGRSLITSTPPLENLGLIASALGEGSKISVGNDLYTKTHCGENRECNFKFQSDIDGSLIGVQEIVDETTGKIIQEARPLINLGVKKVMGEGVVLTTDRNIESVAKLLDLIENKKFNEISKIGLKFDSDIVFEDYILREYGINTNLLDNPKYVEKMGRLVKKRVEANAYLEKLFEKEGLDLTFEEMRSLAAGGGINDPAKNKLIQKIMRQKSKAWWWYTAALMKYASVYRDEAKFMIDSCKGRSCPVDVKELRDSVRTYQRSLNSQAGQRKQANFRYTTRRCMQGRGKAGSCGGDVVENVRKEAEKLRLELATASINNDATKRANAVKKQKLERLKQILAYNEQQFKQFESHVDNQRLTLKAIAKQHGCSGSSTDFSNWKCKTQAKYESWHIARVDFKSNLKKLDAMKLKLKAGGLDSEGVKRELKAIKSDEDLDKEFKTKSASISQKLSAKIGVLTCSSSTDRTTCSTFRPDVARDLMAGMGDSNYAQQLDAQVSSICPTCSKGKYKYEKRKIDGRDVLVPVLVGRKEEFDAFFKSEYDTKELERIQKKIIQQKTSQLEGIKDVAVIEEDIGFRIAVDSIRAGNLGQASFMLDGVRDPEKKKLIELRLSEGFEHKAKMKAQEVSMLRDKRQKQLITMCDGWGALSCLSRSFGGQVMNVFSDDDYSAIHITTGERSVGQLSDKADEAAFIARTIKRYRTLSEHPMRAAHVKTEDGSKWQDNYDGTWTKIGDDGKPKLENGYPVSKTNQQIKESGPSCLRCSVSDALRDLKSNQVSVGGNPCLIGAKCRRRIISDNSAFLTNLRDQGVQNKYVKIDPVTKEPLKLANGNLQYVYLARGEEPPANTARTMNSVSRSSQANLRLENLESQLAFHDGKVGMLEQEYGNLAAQYGDVDNVRIIAESKWKESRRKSTIGINAYTPDFMTPTEGSIDVYGDIAIDIAADPLNIILTPLAFAAIGKTAVYGGKVVTTTSRVAVTTSKVTGLTRLASGTTKLTKTGLTLASKSKYIAPVLETGTKIASATTKIASKTLQYGSGKAKWVSELKLYPGSGRSLKDVGRSLKDAHSVGKIPFTEAHNMRTYASRTFTHLQDATNLLAKAENAGDAAKVAKYSQRVAALKDVARLEVKLAKEVSFLGFKVPALSRTTRGGLSATRRAASGNIKSAVNAALKETENLVGAIVKGKSDDVLNAAAKQRVALKNLDNAESAYKAVTLAAPKIIGKVWRKTFGYDLRKVVSPALRKATDEYNVAVKALNLRHGENLADSVGKLRRFTETHLQHGKTLSALDPQLIQNVIDKSNKLKSVQASATISGSIAAKLSLFEKEKDFQTLVDAGAVIIKRADGSFALDAKGLKSANEQWARTRGWDGVSNYDDWVKGGFKDRTPPLEKLVREMESMLKNPDLQLSLDSSLTALSKGDSIPPSALGVSLAEGKLLVSSLDDLIESGAKLEILDGKLLIKNVPDNMKDLVEKTNNLWGKSGLKAEDVAELAHGFDATGLRLVDDEYEVAANLKRNAREQQGARNPDIALYPNEPGELEHLYLGLTEAGVTFEKGTDWYTHGKILIRNVPADLSGEVNRLRDLVARSGISNSDFLDDGLLAIRSVKKSVENTNDLARLTQQHVKLKPIEEVIDLSTMGTTSEKAGKLDLAPELAKELRVPVGVSEDGTEFVVKGLKLDEFIVENGKVFRFGDDTALSDDAAKLILKRMDVEGIEIINGQSVVNVEPLRFCGVGAAIVGFSSACGIPTPPKVKSFDDVPKGKQMRVESKSGNVYRGEFVGKSKVKQSGVIEEVIELRNVQGEVIPLRVNRLDESSLLTEGDNVRLSLRNGRSDSGRYFGESEDLIYLDSKGGRVRSLEKRDIIPNSLIKNGEKIEVKSLRGNRYSGQVISENDEFIRLVSGDEVFSLRKNRLDLTTVRKISPGQQPPVISQSVGSIVDQGKGFEILNAKGTRKYSGKYLSEDERFIRIIDDNDELFRLDKSRLDFATLKRVDDSDEIKPIIGPLDKSLPATERYKVVDRTRSIGGDYSFGAVIEEAGTGKKFFITDKGMSENMLASKLNEFLHSKRSGVVKNKLRYPEMRFEDFGDGKILLSGWADDSFELSRFDSDSFSTVIDQNLFSKVDPNVGRHATVENIWMRNWDFKAEHMLINPNTGEMTVIDLEKAFGADMKTIEKFGGSPDLDKRILDTLSGSGRPNPYLTGSVDDFEDAIKVIQNLDDADYDIIRKLARESDYSPADVERIVLELKTNAKNLASDLDYMIKRNKELVPDLSFVAKNDFVNPCPMVGAAINPCANLKGILDSNPNLARGSDTTDDVLAKITANEADVIRKAHQADPIATAAKFNDEVLEHVGILVKDDVVKVDVLTESIPLVKQTKTGFTSDPKFFAELEKYETVNPSTLFEEGSLKSIVDGKRPVAIIPPALLKNSITSEKIKKAIDSGELVINEFKYVTKEGSETKFLAVHLKDSEVGIKSYERLKEIYKSGNYVTPTGDREIGRILRYTEESIDEFIGGFHTTTAKQISVGEEIEESVRKLKILDTNTEQFKLHADNLHSQVITDSYGAQKLPVFENSIEGLGEYTLVEVSLDRATMKALNDISYDVGTSAISTQHRTLVKFAKSHGLPVTTLQKTTFIAIPKSSSVKMADILAEVEKAQSAVATATNQQAVLRIGSVENHVGDLMVARLKTRRSMHYSEKFSETGSLVSYNDDVAKWHNELGLKQKATNNDIFLGYDSVLKQQFDELEQLRLSGNNEAYREKLIYLSRVDMQDVNFNSLESVKNYLAGGSQSKSATKLAEGDLLISIDGIGLGNKNFDDVLDLTKSGLTDEQLAKSLGKNIDQSIKEVNIELVKVHEEAVDKIIAVDIKTLEKLSENARQAGYHKKELTTVDELKDFLNWEFKNKARFRGGDEAFMNVRSVVSRNNPYLIDEMQKSVSNCVSCGYKIRIGVKEVSAGEDFTSIISKADQATIISKNAENVPMLINKEGEVIRVSSINDDLEKIINNNPIVARGETITEEGIISLGANELNEIRRLYEVNPVSTAAHVNPHVLSHLNLGGKDELLKALDDPIAGAAFDARLKQFDIAPKISPAGKVIIPEEIFYYQGKYSRVINNDDGLLTIVTLDDVGNLKLVEVTKGEVMSLKQQEDLADILIREGQSSKVVQREKEVSRFEVLDSVPDVKNRRKDGTFVLVDDLNPLEELSDLERKVGYSEDVARIGDDVVSVSDEVTTATIKGKDYEVRTFQITDEAGNVRDISYPVRVTDSTGTKNILFESKTADGKSIWASNDIDHFYDMRIPHSLEDIVDNGGSVIIHEGTRKQTAEYLMREGFDLNSIQRIKGSAERVGGYELWVVKHPDGRVRNIITNFKGSSKRQHIEAALRQKGFDSNNIAVIDHNFDYAASYSKILQEAKPDFVVIGGGPTFLDEIKIMAKSTGNKLKPVVVGEDLTEMWHVPIIVKGEQKILLITRHPNGALAESFTEALVDYHQTKKVKVVFSGDAGSLGKAREISNELNDVVFSGKTISKDEMFTPSRFITQDGRVIELENSIEATIKRIESEGPIIGKEGEINIRSGTTHGNAFSANQEDIGYIMHELERGSDAIDVEGSHIAKVLDDSKQAGKETPEVSFLFHASDEVAVGNPIAKEGHYYHGIKAKNEIIFEHLTGMKLDDLSFPKPIKPATIEKPLTFKQKVFADLGIPDNLKGKVGMKISELQKQGVLEDEILELIKIEFKESLDQLSTAYKSKPDDTTFLIESQLAIRSLDDFSEEGLIQVKNQINGWLNGDKGQDFLKTTIGQTWYNKYKKNWWKKLPWDWFDEQIDFTKMPSNKIEYPQVFSDNLEEIITANKVSVTGDIAVYTGTGQRNVQSGIGSAGDVYKGKIPGVDGEVALKVPRKAEHPDDVAIFAEGLRKESDRSKELSEILSTPKYHGIVDLDGQTALAMEIFEGKVFTGSTFHSPEDIVKHLTPKALQQLDEGLERAAKAGWMTDDVNFVVLTKDQTLNGKNYNKGDVVFFDFGSWRKEGYAPALTNKQWADSFKEKAIRAQSTIDSKQNLKSREATESLLEAEKVIDPTVSVAMGKVKSINARSSTISELEVQRKFLDGWKDYLDLESQVRHLTAQEVDLLNQVDMVFNEVSKRSTELIERRMGTSLENLVDKTFIVDDDLATLNHRTRTIFDSTRTASSEERLVEEEIKLIVRRYYRKLLESEGKSTKFLDSDFSLQNWGKEEIIDYRNAVSTEDGFLDFIAKLDDKFSTNTVKIHLGTDGREYSDLAYRLMTNNPNPNSIPHDISRKLLATNDEFKHIYEVATNPNANLDDIQRLVDRGLFDNVDEFMSLSLESKIESLTNYKAGTIKLYNDVDGVIKDAHDVALATDRKLLDVLRERFDGVMAVPQNRDQVVKLVRDLQDNLVTNGKSLADPVVLIDNAGRAHVQAMTLRESVAWLSKESNWKSLSAAQRTSLGGNRQVFVEAKIDLHLGVGGTKGAKPNYRNPLANMDVEGVYINGIGYNSHTGRPKDVVESYRGIILDDRSLLDGKVRYTYAGAEEEALAMQRRLIIADEIAKRKSIKSLEESITETGELAGKKVPDLADPQVKEILGDVNVGCRIGARTGLAIGVVDCLDPVINVMTKSDLRIASGKLKELKKSDLGEIPLEVSPSLLNELDLPVDFNKLSSEEQLLLLKEDVSTSVIQLNEAPNSRYASRPKSLNNRLNEKSVELLDTQFEEVGDVRGLLMTHSFPIANLDGIVEQGGLITRDALLRKGTDIAATGGGSPVSSKIYFHKGRVAGYGTDAVGEGNLVVLLPQDEFSRIGKIGDDFDHQINQLDPLQITDNIVNPTTEYALSDSIRFGKYEPSESAKSVERIREEMLSYKEGKIAKIEGNLEDQLTTLHVELEMDQFKEIFNFRNPYDDSGIIDQVSFERFKSNLIHKRELDTNSLSRIDVAEDKMRQGISTTIARKHREQIRDVINAENELTEAEKYGWLSSIGKRFGFDWRSKKPIQKAKENLMNVQSELEAVRKPLRDSINELDFKLIKIDEYKVASDKFLKSSSGFKKSAKLEKEAIEVRYKPYLEGDVIPQRLRQQPEYLETQLEIKARLSRSVILVDSKHAKQVFQQLATKPGLRKRVLIVDRDLSYEDWNRLIEPMVFEKAKMVTKPGDVVGYMMPSRYDRAMDLLGRTEDGVELLKSAQKGEDLVGGSKLKSVKLLDEYMAETEELSKIESTFITELGEVAIAAN